MLRAVEDGMWVWLGTFLGVSAGLFACLAFGLWGLFSLPLVVLGTVLGAGAQADYDNFTGRSQ